MISSILQKSNTRVNENLTNRGNNVLMGDMFVERSIKLMVSNDRFVNSYDNSRSLRFDRTKESSKACRHLLPILDECYILKLKNSYGHHKEVRYFSTTLYFNRNSETSGLNKRGFEHYLSSLRKKGAIVSVNCERPNGTYGTFYVFKGSETEEATYPSDHFLSMIQNQFLTLARYFCYKEAWISDPQRLIVDEFGDDKYITDKSVIKDMFLHAESVVGILDRTGFNVEERAIQQGIEDRLYDLQPNEYISRGVPTKSQFDDISEKMNHFMGRGRLPAKPKNLSKRIFDDVALGVKKKRSGDTSKYRVKNNFDKMALACKNQFSDYSYKYRASNYQTEFGMAWDGYVGYMYDYMVSHGLHISLSNLSSLFHKLYGLVTDAVMRVIEPIFKPIFEPTSKPMVKPMVKPTSELSDESRGFFLDKPAIRGGCNTLKDTLKDIAGSLFKSFTKK